MLTKSVLANALTHEQLKHFDDEGYIVVKALFSQDDVKAIGAHLDTVLEGAQRRVTEYVAAEHAAGRELPQNFRCEYSGERGSASIMVAQRDESHPPVIKLVSWAGGVAPDLLTLSRRPHVTIPVGQLLGSEKADPHQDIQFRRLFDENWEDLNKKGSFVQVLTAIDPTPLESGPLMVMPGSHKEDLQLDTIEKEERLARVQQKYDLSKAEALLLEPGDTLFMHPLLLHFSGENTSQNPRRLFINGFSYPGANKKPYPGRGSSEEISLNMPPDLGEGSN